VGLSLAPALDAADNAVLFKFLVKDAAAHRGMLAAFMPKRAATEAASGLRVNQSLWLSGQNVFDDAAGEEFVGEPYLAALWDTARSSFVIGAPTSEAYARRSPSSSANGRTVAIRGLFDRGPRASRIEFGLPGADANPYLVAAANLAVGLTGIEVRTLLPSEARGYVVIEESLQLPATLSAAIAAFDDDRMRAELGHGFVRHYAAVVSHGSTVSAVDL
jgi:glutamine synthetase